MKSKVIDVKYKKEFESKFGVLHQHAINLEIDGTIQWAVYNSKHKDQTKFVKGEEVEFTAIEKFYLGNKYYQVKPMAATKYNSNFSRSLKREQSKYSGFAMAFAKDLVVSGNIESNQMFATAKKMFDWMVEQDKNIENG